jgi:hypothetical protein
MKSLVPTIAIGLCLTARVLTAQTLFSTLGQPNNNPQLTGTTTSFRYATDFQTSANPTSITGLTARFTTASLSASVTLSLYTSAGGAPISLVGSFAPIALPANQTNTDFSTTTSGISLAANTAYWLVLQLNANDANGVGWAFNSGQGTDSGSIFTTIFINDR